jgi:hypothetical protein
MSVAMYQLQSLGFSFRIIDGFLQADCQETTAILPTRKCDRVQSVLDRLQEVLSASSGEVDAY